MDPFTILGIGFTAIGLFLGFFFLFRTQLKSDHYLFLYLALILLCFEIFYKTLIHSKLIYEYIALYQPGRYFNLLIYPIFLFFIWSVTKKPFHLSIRHWLVIVLFTAYALYKLAHGLSISPDEKKQLLDLFYEDRRPGPFNYWSTWGTFIQSTLVPVYFLSLISFEFFRFRQKVHSIQSKRLLHVLALTIAVYFLYSQFSNWIYRWVYQLTDYSMIEWPTDILFLSILIALLSILTLSVHSGATFFPPAKYAASSFDRNSYEQLIQQARNRVEDQELFKNRQLTIADLSALLEISPKYLSQALNDHLGLSFVAFINLYRVEEAKKQLVSERNRSLTIEAIGHLVGFHSKSSFFRAFKKHTGRTPSQFMKSADRSLD